MEFRDDVGTITREAYLAGRNGKPIQAPEAPPTAQPVIDPELYPLPLAAALIARLLGMGQVDRLEVWVGPIGPIVIQREQEAP